MIPPLSCRTSLVATTVTFAVGVLFSTVAFRGLVRQRRAQAGLAMVYVVLASFHGAWAYGGRVAFSVSHWGAAFACVGLVLLAFVVASLPLAALVGGAATLAVRALPRPVAATNPGPPEVAACDAVEVLPPFSRRAFVTVATASVPMAALAAATRGFLEADDSPGAPRRVLRFPSLAKELEGVCILHLTDLHLGVGRTTRDLEALLLRLEDAKVRPDLVVLTGDIAERPEELMPALRLVAAVKAPGGAFACLGNHEYLNDLRRFRPIFDRGPVSLLVDEGVRVTLRGQSVYVAGVDDPIFIRGAIGEKLDRSLDRALRDERASDFTVLLSHRPEGFDAASRHGVPLTLAGHTHGGQIAFNGKSAFEPLWPDANLWGAYGRKRSRLYTSSGFGHWFPFRLGCPTEAPLVILASEHESSRRKIVV